MLLRMCEREREREMEMEPMSSPLGWKVGRWGLGTTINSLSLLLHSIHVYSTNPTESSCHRLSPAAGNNGGFCEGCNAGDVDWVVGLVWSWIGFDT